MVALVAVTSGLSGANDGPLEKPSAEGTERAASFDEERTRAVERRAPRYTRANYLWPFATGPSYGRAVSARELRNTPGLFRAPSGTFDLESGLAGVPPELRATGKTFENGSRYFVVALDPQSLRTGALRDLQDAVDLRGGAIVRFAPVASAIARLTPEAFAEVSSLPGVLAVEPYHPAFKLHPTIGRVPLLDPIKAVSEVYDLDVRVFQGEDASAVAAALETLGGQVTSVFPDTVRVEIHRSRLAQVAALEPVEVVFEHLPVVPFDEETTTTIQTGSYNQGAMPYHDAGIDGGGGGIDGSAGGGFAAQPQVLMILDTGIQLDAADLAHSRLEAGTAGPGHRKVRLYQTTEDFGGDGDLRGCDAPASDGFTHGHTVAAVALGRATRVDTAEFGEPFFALDAFGNAWGLDGLAPGAVLVSYDAQRTPAATSCADPMLDTLAPGDLYSDGNAGSLADAFLNHGARIFNLSWGHTINFYSSYAIDVDQFLHDNQEAMVFIAAGNDADAGIGSPAGAKNALAIGASNATLDLVGEGGEETRWSSSAIGPAPGERVAPQLMAPGWDLVEGTGLYSAVSCRSRDNDQQDPVECDTVSHLYGTSYSSAAVAGAALLVRDYFAQGFYPDGTSTNPDNAADQVDHVSGALVKALMITSADFMDGKGHVFYRLENYTLPSHLIWRHRFNNEQGYGRVKLDNALPLQSWPFSPPALAIADGGVDGGVQNISGLDGLLDVTAGETDLGEFEICDSSRELRVALAWFDAPGEMLINDLDLELTSPGGTTYFGNYFTDDDNGDGEADSNTEDCPSPDGQTRTVDASAWSLAVCQRPDGSMSPRDRVNPTEAIMLSPDPLGNGMVSQTEAGTWTVKVSGAGGMDAAQRYAVVVVGGLCSGSRVQLDQFRYGCNDRARIVVTDHPEPGDPDPTVEDVEARTTVQVLDGVMVVDEEVVSGFTAPTTQAGKFESPPLVLTDGTAPDPGNGVLDVRDGNVLRVRYADVGPDGVTPDPERERISEANVDCRTKIAFGSVRFEQFGTDTAYRVSGGCERNARGEFDYGYPDKYMDAGETVSLAIGFSSVGYQDVEEVYVRLRCVVPDADSPAWCGANSLDCPDPERSNNPSCDQNPTGGAGDIRYMTILDSPRRVGLLAARAPTSVSFTIRMEETIPGTPQVEMVMTLEAPTSGKTTPGVIVLPVTLDVDEQSLWYSTDFPTGGTEYRDTNNNEIIEDPASDRYEPILDPAIRPPSDYRFETWVYSDMTAGGTKNTLVMSPWNFDANDGGFTSGLLATADESNITNTIAQWGEDKNFNGVDDKRCSNNVGLDCTRDSDCDAPGQCVSVEQRDPTDNVLDKNWSIRGGCGWQTKPPGTCSNDVTQGCFDDGDCVPPATCSGPSSTGGIWHTGRIGGTTGNCLVVGNNPGQCQSYEVVGGTTGTRTWAEALVTPVVQKVNGDDYRVEITRWAWNQAIDLPDDRAAVAWEIDGDLTSVDPVDLYRDGQLKGRTFLGFLDGHLGPVGAVTGADYGFYRDLFAPLDASRLFTQNGILGNNREGKNACFFEGGNVTSDYSTLGGDDDVDNDGDGLVDEFVTPYGPGRNHSAGEFRYFTLEDRGQGAANEWFQAAVTMINLEAWGGQSPAIGYGLGIDDMVLEWREYALAQDTSDCGAGECAVLDLKQANGFQGSDALEITVIERSPPATNDCDLSCLAPGDSHCAGAQVFCVGGVADGQSCTDVSDDTDCPGDPTADPPILAGDCQDYAAVCLPACAEGGPSDPRDCDDDGVPDVVVKIKSSADPGEIVYVNATGEEGIYKAQIPTSADQESEGVLFVGAIGGEKVEVEAEYPDHDDGTGNVCANSFRPERYGVVTASMDLYLLTGDVRVTGKVLDDNGDRDGFADTDETVAMQIRIRNAEEFDLTGVIARLFTYDASIACILDSSILIGDVPAKSEQLSTEAFVFRVGDVDRTGLGLGHLDDLSATFGVLLSSDQFDSTARKQEITLDLDLDAVGGGGPTTFFESFESGTLGAFEADNIDQNLGSLSASDGYRCQYHDPDWPASHSYGQITDCYLTASPAHADGFYWQVHTPDEIDGGKAYSGTNSLYMGIFGQEENTHTTPLAVLEAVQLREPINLDYVGESPQLTFKHQISLLDNRSVDSWKPKYTPGTAVGRGVVQAQLANAYGAPVGNWIKIHPYLNVYDQQAFDFYYNCTFDPVSDGNTEDDFFDPLDPDRRHGPSSTCFPEFSFAFMGDTFDPYSDANLGNAEGPGLRGTLGTGTWVESRFNLDRFRGRRVRLRFLNTDIKGGPVETWESAFRFNPNPGDDGWWIDDVMVTNTLLEPVVFTNDDKDNSSLPGCGNLCNVVDAALAADPPGALPAPRQVVELSAVETIADRCVDGALQFRFWRDRDGDGAGGGPSDELMRGWTLDAAILDAPPVTTTYVVESRCSSDPTCSGSAALTVRVDCPATGNLGGFPEIAASDPATLTWGSPVAFDFSQGLLNDLAVYGTTDTGQGLGPAEVFDIGGDLPAAGQGTWYLFRQTGTLGGGTGYCNAPGITWGTPTRDGTLP
jgi:hypothetical protein